MASRLLLFLTSALAVWILYSLFPTFSSYARSLAAQLPLQLPLQASVPAESKAFARRIVAVGDLHGDLPNAKQVLRMAHVIDDNDAWSGEADVFVQTGDIIDRGDDTIALFEYMDVLREQAHAAGQTVLSHLGNHEWMNLISDWRFVYPSEIATFGGVAERQAALSATGALGRTWTANYTTTSRLPLHPALGPPNTPYPPSNDSVTSAAGPLSHAAFSFVHGGLSPDYPDLTPFPSRINELSSRLLARVHARVPPPPPHPPAPYAGLPADTPADEAGLLATGGPLWFRGWALEDENVVCERVDGVLTRTGTRRMVMGHTPDFRKIVSRCGGKIIIIDTGISHAYGGALSALTIDYTLTPLSPSTPLQAGEERRWVEREIVRAVYTHREEILVDEGREVMGNFAGWH